ncbi:MAG: hypothetical protein NVSMB45_04960 [Ginsengibacter sp.]
MKFPLYFFILFFSISSFGQDVNKILKQATEFENSLDENGALNKYLELAKVDPDNCYYLSKVSELYSSIGGRLNENPERQQTYFNSALVYANRALKVNSRSSDANFVMALVMGRTALKKSSRQKVEAVKDIKKYTDLSLAYNPNNYKAWFLLGKWNYEISALNFFERTALKVFYGDLPNASTKDALKCYQKSMDLNPGFLYNYLSLARVYIRMGDKPKALLLLSKMISLPNKTADDPNIKIEAVKLMQKL